MILRQTYATESTDQLLVSLTSVESLSAYLLNRRAELNVNAGHSKSGGIALANKHSDLLDNVVRRMLAIAWAQSGGTGGVDNAPVAIVATGGYGRRQICPYSDVDLTFIPVHDGDPTADKIIKEMFTLVMKVFMDSCGLQVGYAYRLKEDCPHLDHKTCCGLLDARFIAGSSRLFIQFEDDFWNYFNPANFIFTKLLERDEQSKKTGGTARIIEPNLKEGCGGMRDIQTAIWITQARKSLTASRVRGERCWEVLEKDANLSLRDIDKLKNAGEFLFRVRNALHFIVGAERDQLVVTRQEEVAERMGYGGTDHLEHETPPVELFMRDFYANTTEIDRICRDIRNRAANSRLVLGIGLDCKRKQIVPANQSLANEDSLWMLWACELAQIYDLELSSGLEQIIVELTSTNPPITDTKLAGDILIRLLSSPKGAYPILQKMADIGILSWLLPDVGNSLNLIPYDPSHDYTVGQHTLYVIKYLDSLRKPSQDEDMRDYRMTMSELRHPEELYLAALLHDVGKFESLRPHAEVGEELASVVCQKFGWSQTATANVRFLVRHHLLMSETSRLRDLNLDQTIRDFVSVVDDLDRLHMLYLLTYADTNAVADGIWNQPKGKFQRDLLHKAERALAGEDFVEIDEAGLNRTRLRMQKQLSMENLPASEVEEHIQCMPSTYLLNTSSEEISLHIGFVRSAKLGKKVVIDFLDERDNTYTEVTVCTLDDPEPGLLAKIAGVFYACDLDVHSAQIFTRVSPDVPRVAIDKFMVDFRGRQLTQGKRKEISMYMSDVMTDKLSVAELLSKHKKSPNIGGAVSDIKVRYDVSASYAVIEVAAFEDKAMLYRASAALSKLSMDIVSARVSPFHGQNVAVFYVAGIQNQSEQTVLTNLTKLMPIVTDKRR